MKIARVYIDEQLKIGGEITLDKDAFKYVVRVLRRREGDPLVLFNGDGFNYRSTLKFTTPSIVIASIKTKVHNDTESPLHINLVQSLAKGTKLDLVIQKATELGVNRIIPVTSERSVLQIDRNRIDRKLTHWQGIAVSAATQCQRSVVPIIESPVSFIDWIDSCDKLSSCLLLDPSSKRTLKDIKLDSPDCSLLVGPEGGFTTEEINHATDRGATTFQCGPRILRTETAGFTAISVLQSVYGDF